MASSMRSSGLDLSGPAAGWYVAGIISPSSPFFGRRREVLSVAARRSTSASVRCLCFAVYSTPSGVSLQKPMRGLVDRFARLIRSCAQPFRFL